MCSQLCTSCSASHKKKKKKRARHVIELRDSHPSHGAHVPPLSLEGGWRARFDWTKGKETETGSVRRDRKRETSASHLDGKIPNSPDPGD